MAEEEAMAGVDDASVGEVVAVESSGGVEVVELPVASALPS